MDIYEYVAPVISVGGPIALVIVALRYGPDAVLRLLAGVVAVIMCDKKQRSNLCLEVLRILHGRDQPSPSLPDEQDHQD